MPQWIEHPEDIGLPEDLVAIGGELTTETLIEAYKMGVFPWPEDDGLPVLWFRPNPRGILRHQNLHVSRSLKRSINQKRFDIRVDTSFIDVIHHCRLAPRKDQQGTWITPAMEAAYIELHRQGIAHSVESFKDGKLVGGVYGVYINNTFSGESMFHLCSDASKVALVALVRGLATAGVEWLDTQMLTSTTEALGGELVSKTNYMAMLAENRDNAVIPWSRIQSGI